MNLAEVIVELKNSTEESLESQQTVEDHVVSIHDMMGTLIAGQAKGMASLYNVMAKIHNVLLESLRRAHERADTTQDREELGRLGGSRPSSPEPIDETSPSASTKPPKSSGIDLMDLLLAGGLLYTFRGQIAAATKAMMNGVRSSVVGTLEAIGNTIHSTVLAIVETKWSARAITKTITSSRLYTAIASVLTTLRNSLGAMGDSIVKLGKSVYPFFARTLKTIQTIIGSILRPIAVAFNAVTGRLAHILSFVPKIAGWLAGVIRIVALPITILMGIWETFKGAQERLRALESSRTLDRGMAMLVGGLEGLAKFLVGYPLDLIKTITGWVAQKLGYDQIRDKLDSFSFTDIIGGLFDAVHFGLSNFVNGFRDTFSKLFSGDFSGAAKSYVDMMTRSIKAMMQYILSKLANVPIVGSRIPDSFYQKFGVDPTTGAKTADFTPPGARTNESVTTREDIQVRHMQYMNDKNNLFADEKLGPDQFNTKSQEVLRQATELNTIDKSLVTDKELNTLRSDISQTRDQLRREKDVQERLKTSEISRSAETMQAHKMTNDIRTTTMTNRIMAAQAAQAPVVVAAPSKTNNNINTQNVSLAGGRIATSDETDVASSYTSRFSGR